MNGFKIASWAIIAFCMLLIIVGIFMLFMTEVPLLRRIIGGSISIFAGVAFGAATWELQKEW